MGQILGDTCVGFGAELAEFHGEAKVVHPAGDYLPTVAISRPVGSLNRVSFAICGKGSPTCAHYWQATCPLFAPCFAGLLTGPPITTGLEASALATILVAQRPAVVQPTIRTAPT